MNIRSITELNQYLNDELAWRKRELTSAKFAASRAKSIEQEVLIKSAICLLYSHWEGFIKRASMAYLNYLSKLGLTQREAEPSIIAFCFSGRFRTIADTRKYTLMAEVIADLVGPGNETLNIPWDNMMSENANLNSTLLREIAHVTNIDYSDYATKEKLIDERLLRTRHAIAHGDQLSVDWNEYENLHNQIISLIDLFRNQVENSIALQSYRRTSV